MRKRPAGKALAEPPAIRRASEPPAEQAEDDEDMPGLRGPDESDDDVPAQQADGNSRASDSRAAEPACFGDEAIPPLEGLEDTDGHVPVQRTEDSGSRASEPACPARLQQLFEVAVAADAPETDRDMVQDMPLLGPC